MTLLELQEKLFTKTSKELNLTEVTKAFNDCLSAYDNNLESCTNIEQSARMCLYLFFYLLDKGEIKCENLDF